MTHSEYIQINGYTIEIPTDIEFGIVNNGKIYPDRLEHLLKMIKNHESN